ncbi:MAG: S1 RNA-binding domain-containing protein, partial [Planctomycetota bacterium]|nr:S1 RNA-binding domain-containing protein [Planctomycetota bacterium]
NDSKDPSAASPEEATSPEGAPNVQESTADAVESTASVTPEVENAAPAETPSADNSSVDTASTEAVAPEVSEEVTPKAETSEAETSEAEEAATEPTATEQVASEVTSEAPAEKKKVAIGSQRDASAEQSAPAVPKQVREAAETPPLVGQDAKQKPKKRKPGPVKPSGPVPVPSKRQRDEKEDAELESVLAGQSMEDLVAKSDAQVGEEVELDSRLKATVSRIHEDNVFFTLKGQYEGLASVRSFKKPPEVGAMVEVVVKKYLADEGLYEVGIPGSAVDVADWADVEKGSVVEVRVTGSNTGGLECMVNTIRGFIPASQIEIHRVENFSEYVNQKMTCVVTEANKKRKNLVLSRRAILEQKLAEERKERMAAIQPGVELPGKVTRLMDFGAFVDIGGGVEGLVHISKLSWDRIGHPKEVLEAGQDIQVKVEKVNAKTGKIALSHRDTIEHPWHNIDSKYAVGSTVQGKVTRLAQFGAFVRLEPGVEGLIHISELAHHRVVAVKNVVKEGDDVEVKILTVDAESQKMGLSLKATQPEPEKPAAKSDKDGAPENQRPMAVPRRDGPLKGGRDKGAGGENFGLNW